MRWKRYRILILSLLFLSLVPVLQILVDSRGRRGEKRVEFRFLPRGEYLKVAAVGYNQLVADLLWLRTIQEIAEGEESPERYERLFQAFDLVTTLDPRFDYAYQVGGIILSISGERVDLSNRILEKGLRETPHVWQIPFYLGYNYFFHLREYQKAAQYIARAALLPGRPSYLPLLASRLWAQSRNIQTAIEFIQRVYEQTEDEVLRAQLEKRLKELIVERDIEVLTEAVKVYRERFSSDPDPLERLVTEGVLSRLPADPFGGRYYFDKIGREVKSESITKQMRVFQ